MKKNIIANVIGKFWSVLSGFLFIPLYIKFLGFESYAVISFTLIIAGVMAVLDAGLTATLSREFARADQSIVEKRRVFKTLETTYFLIIICISSLIFFFSNSIAINWLNLKAINPDRVAFFIKIIGFEAGFQMLFRFYMGGVLGFEKQVKANMFQVGWGIFRNGLVVIAIYFLPKLEVFFIWQLVSTVVFTIAMRLFLVKTLTSQYSFAFKPILEKDILLKLWRFAGGVLLISLVAALNTQMDKLAISKLLDIENLGYYTLAVSIAMGILVLVTPISVALLPRFTALYTNGAEKEATELFNKVNLLVGIIVFAFMANMIIYGKDLIWVWTGNLDLAGKSGIFLAPLAVSFAMLALQIIPYDVAIANGYTKLNNILGIVSLALTMPGYWIATQHFGAIGAAIVYSTVQVTFAIIYLYFINKKFLKSNLYDLFFKRLVFPLLIALLIAYCCSLFPITFAESRILTLVRIGLFTVVTLVATLLIFIPVQVVKDVLIKK